jgi:murein DD-endopeptidase MepM/ murein hydrolase activator NlpD
MQDHYTLILVPDHQSRVRRLRLDRRWLRRGAVAGAVVVALVVAMAVDWVLLRRDAIDVTAMRSEAEALRTETASLRDGLAKVQSELGGLEEFERKVRVIANLPDTLARATPGLPGAPGGVGGPEEGDDGVASPPAPAAEPPVADQPEPAAAAAEPASDAPGPSAAAEPGRPTPFAADRAEAERLSAWADQLLHDLRMRRASYAALVDGLEGSRVRLASTPSIWPTEGWVTSGYGRRISPFTGQPDFHAGIDIAADFGTPVVAPAAGRVVFSGRKGPLGRAVILEHGYGIRTVYGHLSEAFVKRGERVERGQRIGAVGSSGRSTGPHLHYAVLLRGKTVNPIDYVLN